MRGGHARLVPWVVAGALLAGTATGVGLVAAIGSPARPEDERHLVELSFPREPESSVAIPSLEEGSVPPLGGPRLLLDPALLEPTLEGGIPRVAPDGRRPIDMHRRRAPLGSGPAASIVLIEIGLQRAASIAAGRLSEPITLAVSPYAEDTAAWLRAARWRGHETLLELPIRPAGYPVDDAGPLSLSSEPEDVSRLDRALARGMGYLGVAVRAGVFKSDAQAFMPIARTLAQRGLALVELGSDGLATVARDTGLAYLTIEGPIDQDGGGETIDAALSRLEARARSDGSAAAFARPLEITIDRLARWSSTLPGKGIELVGVGALLERARERKG